MKKKSIHILSYQIRRLIGKVGLKSSLHVANVVDKSPMQEEDENALEGDKDLDKKFNLGELNVIAYEDLILSINTNYSLGKVGLGLVRNVKSLVSPEGNCNAAWNRLINKYAPILPHIC